MKTKTPKTFEQLVEANNFGYKYITNIYKPEKPKKGTVKIELWHPNKYTTNQEFLDYCKANNRRPATFNEALQFALDNSDEQKKQSLVTYDLQQLCSLYLDSDGDERGLDVYEYRPDDDWSGSVGFLVVPAPASAPAGLDSEKLGSAVPFDPRLLEISYNGKKYKVVEE